MKPKPCALVSSHAQAVTVPLSQGFSKTDRCVRVLQQKNGLECMQALPEVLPQLPAYNTTDA